MNVRFFLCVDAKDGSTCLEMTTDVPFAPRVGDHFVFCGELCCERGVWIKESDRVAYFVKENCWLAEIVDQTWASSSYSLQHVVDHYLACGFVEVEGCREEKPQAPG